MVFVRATLKLCFYSNLLTEIRQKLEEIAEISNFTQVFENLENAAAVFSVFSEVFK